MTRFVTKSIFSTIIDPHVVVPPVHDGADGQLISSIGGASSDTLIKITVAPEKLVY